MVEKNSENKFLILDGHSLAYRAFFALPLDLKTKTGLHTGAVLGFTNMFFRLLKDESPGYAVVAFDFPAPTFRHKQYEEYKATREKTPAEMSEQLPLIKDILEAFKTPVLEVEGFEADDIIATLTKEGEESGLEPLIVTADADLYQLLSQKTKVLITKKGISQVETVTVDTLKENYGLEPAQWIDYKALKGDSSDNVPGVPGIGEKRALQLLKEYYSLERLLASRQGLKGKIGKTLHDYVQQALLSKELVTVRKDVPLDISLENCRVAEPLWEKLYHLFTTLEFKNLIEKTPTLNVLRKRSTADSSSFSSLNNPTQIQQGLTWGNHEEDDDQELHDIMQSNGPSGLTGGYRYQKIQYYSAESQEDILFLKKKLEDFSVFSILLHFDSFQRKDGPVGFAFAVKEEGFYLSFSGNETGINIAKKLASIWEKVLLNPEKEVITHDLKPLLKLFLKGGIEPSCSFFDTMLAAYLLQPDSDTYSIPALCCDYLGGHPQDTKKIRSLEENGTADTFLSTSMLPSLFALAKKLGSLLKDSNMYALYFDLELPLVRVLADMELRGIMVKEDVLLELEEEVDRTLSELKREIIELAGIEFNINSPKQLGFILFERLNLPVIRKGKTGYSTDAKVLQDLSAYHPIASQLLKYRMVAKLKSTYLEGLRPLISKDTGKIHTTFNQAVTATGRLSSTYPNLQNIPFKLEEGRRLRKAFTVSQAGNLLLAADYSQIELRILAHFSRDANLLDAFWKGQDIHVRTAAEVFNVDPEDVTAAMRSGAKAVNFGIIYGISDYGLSRDLQISRAEAKLYIANYFERYPGVKRFVEECIANARQKGYVTTVLNRRRYLFDINHSHFSKRSFAERMARNTPIQGSAADIIKKAMLDIDRALKKESLKAAMLLQVHDELVFELPAEEMEEVTDMVKTIMENVVHLDVPLKVDFKVGKDWYHLYPMEEV